MLFRSFHYILMQILMAARARGVQAIDGPFLQVRDVPAFEEVAKRSAMLGDEMIDEASRKMALVIAGKGRAAGLQRTSTFTPPE